MARGNQIVVSADPRGRFKEGRISGALKPGTLLQVLVSAGVGDDGRVTYEAAGAYHGSTSTTTLAAGHGKKRELIVLLPDDLQGKTVDTAYADGDRCFVYIPRAGEELNVLTDSAVAFGDDLEVIDGSGKVQPYSASGSSNEKALKAMETLAQNNNQLVWAEVQ